MPSRDPSARPEVSSASTSAEATGLLRQIASGAGGDARRLLELVYDEMRGLASGYLERERPDHTLQPTALVHEAWLRLIDQERVDWQGRAHFLGIAAQAMRRILVDHARAKQRFKRGGDRGRVELESGVAGAGADGDLDLVALDSALSRLREVAERPARVVELRFFAGATAEAAGEALGISLSTVEREWRFARAWLAREIEAERGR